MICILLQNLAWKNCLFSEQCAIFLSVFCIPQKNLINFSIFWIMWRMCYVILQYICVTWFLIFLIFIFILFWPFVSLDLVKSSPCYVGLFIGPLSSIWPVRSICFDQLLGSSAFTPTVWSFIGLSGFFLIPTTSIYSKHVELLHVFSAITMAIRVLPFQSLLPFNITHSPSSHTFVLLFMSLSPLGFSDCFGSCM